MNDQKDQRDLSRDRIWYIRRGADVRGPLPSARIRRYLLDGQLQVDDQVSRDRHSWQALGRIPDLIPPGLRKDLPDSAAEDLEERRRERRIALTTALVVAALLIGALLAALNLNGTDGADPRDCAAPPARDVNWSNCQLHGLQAEAVDLSGLRASNSRLLEARLRGAILEGADLRYADLAGADLSYARLNASELKGANLRGADLSYANLSGADLRYTDFGGARLGGAELRGARLEGSRWPDGSECAAGSIGRCVAPNP